MSWLRRLSEALDRRGPAGYRPGVTLGHVRRDFHDWRCEPLDARGARFGRPGAALVFEVRERTQSELLMHLVLTDFIVRAPARHPAPARLDVRHTGAWRRTGLRYAARRGAPPPEALLAELREDPALRAALMPLDFKRLRIERQAAGWTATLEHMAGSEVVNRMPAFRRYIAFAPAQRDALLAALARLQAILARH
ncbi:DUF3156 family protein [Castellaniella defragrans]|uniref:DUF3156 family protein n=3 Tax=Castellaniella defragrans TaxID=75697 RepID=A0A7W9TPM6_CASDE|nr:DUF3156 family protein [Castellaniella defragrans]MBB6084191.1 hypothetical protein [Castellaniella defragrans]